MNATFLQKLASETLSLHPEGLDKTCFVFPSKRSGLFFKKELAKSLQKTFWSPNIITVDSFIEDLSGLNIIDPLEQLFELYEVHKELNIQPQLPFDRFIDVGKIILADFNDIDMALADANALFTNVKDYVQLEKWDVEQSGTEKLTEKYLESYADLPRYYSAYQKRLLSSGKAYQGLIYRQLESRISKNDMKSVLDKLSKWTNIYVAGLNALTRAEQFFFDWLTAERGLKIYFEAESQMISDYDQESGLFIRDFHKKQGSNFKWATDNLTHSPKDINTYAVNGNIAMARMVGELFERDPNLTIGNETAIVLADEGLLMPVLESLPSKVGAVNVTLGFPLGLTAFMSFTEQIFGMQRLASIRNGKRHFYFKDVMKVITNPILTAIIGEEKLFEQIAKDLTKSNLVWIEETYFKNLQTSYVVFNDLEYMFEDWKKSPALSVSFLNMCLSKYQEKIEGSGKAEDVLLEQMYYFKNSVVKLKGYLKLYANQITLEGVRRIFKHVVSKIQVPFSGEPLAGIQIMGLLETRLLSFKNVIFISVNEGVIPSKGGFQSLLPFTLRSGFKIQTHQDRESIFAYHFYRVLSQAQNIHLIFDSSTAGIGSHEKSRFVRQIEQEWPEINKDIIFKNHIGIFESAPAEDGSELQKTPQVIQNIREYLTQRGLSPSALNNYVESPIDFYYGNVIGIREPNAIEEDMEHNTFGSIVHDCLEKFYIPFENKVLNSVDLKKAFQTIDTVIKAQFSEVIPHYSRGKHYLSYYSVEKYVKRFIELDIEFIKSHKFPITLVKNEMNLKHKLNVAGNLVLFGGKADRVEMRQGIPYIIDYKTGAVDGKDLKLTAMVELKGGKYKPKFVQLLMYAWLAQKQIKSEGIVSGIYTLRDTQLNLLSASLNNNEILGSQELQEFEGFVTDKINEMLDPDVPLVRNPEYQFAVF